MIYDSAPKRSRIQLAETAAKVDQNTAAALTRGAPRSMANDKVPFIHPFARFHVEASCPPLVCNAESSSPS